MKSILDTKPIGFIQRVFVPVFYTILLEIFTILISPPLKLYSIFVFIGLLLFAIIISTKRNAFYIYSMELYDTGELKIQYLHYKQKKVKTMFLSDLEIWKKALAYKFREIIAIELRSKDFILIQYPNYFLDGSIWNDTQILVVYEELLELKENSRNNCLY